MTERDKSRYTEGSSTAYGGHYEYRDHCLRQSQVKLSERRRRGRSQRERPARAQPPGRVCGTVPVSYRGALRPNSAAVLH
ncbi:hypothetical protein EVAR_12554_1 [Eumeta japonica]|uniref:Uncharacterized protein n=1 Tax=Eumeta variegata TaxID=151549 RepID=A0A4C1TPU7_EUMVA|nr:hypothetical protein EVAR_12554_1 [Eumeta japonica]